MMHVLTFKLSSKGKVHISVDGEYKMTVDNDFPLLLKYYENNKIGDEELAELEAAVNSRRAFNKAVDLLSRRDHSEGELVEKLKQRDIDEESALSAVEKLKDYGYLDDRHFAKGYAAELQRLKGFGKRRIVQELYRKRVSRDIIDEVLEEMEFSDEELALIIKRKYLRYLVDEKGVKKTVNALIRRGYSYGEIKSALERATQDEE